VHVTAEITGRDKLLAAFLKMPRETAKNLRVALKEGLTLVQRQARRVHGYTSRTGMLARSVMIDVARSGYEGRVYLDKGLAYYGPYIHEGWDTYKGHKVNGRAPDKFLHEAFEDKYDDVMAKINEAVDLSITQAFGR
jgi:hypothetical protein